MIYLVIGRREKGKTTLAYWMAHRIGHRAMLDPRGMVRRSDKSIEYAETITEARDSIDGIGLGEVSESIYHPSEDDLQGVFVSWTSSLKQIVRSRPSMELAIVVDEASFFDLESPSFQWLAKCSFRDLVHIFVTAHRPIDVPTSIRSIADHWFIFATSQEHDLKAIESRTSPRVAATAKTMLADRAFVHWDDTKGEMRVNTQARSWYIDLRPQIARAKPVTPDGSESHELPFEKESLSDA